MTGAGGIALGMTTPVLETDHMTIAVMLRRELLDEGWNDKAIRKLLRAGTWTRVRHGAYVATSDWERIDAAGRHVLAIRCVLRQAKTKVVVSHTSAAVLYGAPTWGLSLGDVHVTRVDGRIGRHEAGVHQHCGGIDDGDVIDHRGVPVMNPTRVALEITTVTSVEAAMGVVSDLLHKRRTTPEQLEERYTRSGNALTQWPGTRATELVLRLSDARLESIGEVRTFYLLFRNHVPIPEPQYEVFDASGALVARVDFAWPARGVFMEFDGKVKYEKLLRPGERASDVVVREKKREELVCRLTGWRCIRIVWADLERPERTAALILSILLPEPVAAS